MAAGVPAVTVSAAGPSAPTRGDTLDTVSEQTLTKVGTTVQNMVMAVDGTSEPGAPSGGAIFLTRRATLPGAALATILAALLLPLVAVTVDLFAHCRRSRIRLKPAFVRAGLHLAPWLVLIGIVYFANLVGLLPHSPDAVDPPGLPPGRLTTLPARGRPRRAHAARLRLRGGRRAAARAAVRHRRPRHHPGLPPAAGGHRAAPAAHRPLRGAPGAAGSRPLAARTPGRLDALDPAGVPGAAHGADPAHLLRAAAGRRLEGVVVLLPALREPHDPGGRGAAGGAVLLHGRRARAHAPRARAGARRALLAGGGPAQPGAAYGRGVGRGSGGRRPQAAPRTAAQQAERPRRRRRRRRPDERRRP